MAPARMLRATLTLAAALALLLGVPFLLTTGVGWPLPTSVPDIQVLQQVARSGISDEVIVDTLSVIAWFVWAQLALSVIIEISAVARGRQAIRLPVLPGLQITAARLVGGILIAATPLQPVRVAAATPIPVVAESPASTAEPDAAALMPDEHGPVPVGTAADPTIASSGADPPTVTVQRHDSYWAVAERTLGDGLRWREVRDLNIGRRLPDGTTITAGDDSLHTGAILLLPAEARPAGAGPLRPDATAPPGPTSVVVEPGDNLWDLSTDRLESDLLRHPEDPEIDPYWREVIDANADRYVQTGNPDLILPGQEITLPPTGVGAPSPEAESEPAPLPTEPGDRDPSPAPESTPDPSPTTTEAPAATATSRPSPDERTPTSSISDDTEKDRPVLPVTVGLGGLSSIALAVGLKRLINRRRRRLAGTPGRGPGTTPPEQRNLHKAIVARADEDHVDDLQDALGRLAATLAATGSARRPRMVRHSHECLEVLLDQPDTYPPDGWTATEDGSIWSLDAAPDADDAHEGPMCPAPLMVTIGQPEDDAQLYLDLETDGLISLTGDPTVAADLARSILTELTLSPLADTLRVIAVGDIVGPEAGALGHLDVAQSWEDLGPDLTAWAEQSHDALDENEWPNAFVGRGHEPDHDALVALAVVADHPPPDQLAQALHESLPSAVAVVVIGDFKGAAASIRCEDDTLNFDSMDLACSPQGLDGDELTDVSRILVDPESEEEQHAMEELLAEYGGSSGSDDPSDSRIAADEGAEGEPETGTGPDEPPAYDVLVRLLGDITVDGGRSLKPKSTSVVAYLALHRAVSTDRLEEACWFGADGTSHLKRLRDTMTECRAALGSQHLPANRTGTYVAGPGIRTDLDLFEWHLQRAADLEPQSSVAHYRAALDLVTARPFAYPNSARASYGWVDLEHHATAWETRIATAAQQCTDLYVELGQPDAANAMLCNIVQAIPLNSAVVEALMRVHIAEGDGASARRVYDAHAGALEQAKLGDPDDALQQLRVSLESRRFNPQSG